MTNDIVTAREKCQELKKLVGEELSIVTTFLQRLMEFNRAKLHEKLGYASLWSFCRSGLGLCESTAGRRIKAITVIERFPAAVDFLRDGRLCVTRLLLLSDALTAENAASLLERASHKSLKEIELVAATANPLPAPSARIQKFPTKPEPAPADPVLAFDAPVPAQPDPTPPQPASPVPEPDPSEESTVARAPLPSPRRRSTVRPTSAQEYSARLPVSREWVQKLELAKKLGSHVVPTGDPVTILELALDLFIEKHGKRRGAIAPKPRAKKKTEPKVAAAAEESGASKEASPKKKERFTAEDRRTLWNRDGAHCVWPIDGGDVCGSEWQLEADHVEAKARGGASEPGSARLLCRPHNDQHARETFGEAFMQEKKRAPRVVSGVASSSGGDE